MASTNAIAYFPSAINSSTSVTVAFTTGISKTDIPALNGQAAEYHLVFPQDEKPAIRIRFSTSTAQGIAYSNFLKDYGNSVAGS